MLKSAEIRIALILCFGIAAALSPDVGGWPWIFDGWLWTGFRDLPIRMPPMIPLLLAAAMAIADCAGAALPDWKVRVRRPLAWAAAVVLIAGCLLWTFRVRRWFGDLVGVDTQPLWGYTIEPAEPLGMLVTYLTAKWSAVHGLLPSTGIAAVTAVFGAAAVGAIFLWTQSLTPSWPLPFLMMLSSGFMILFFGYPEKGTPKSLALVPWYLYLGTRALRGHGRRFNAGSSAVLSVASLMHGSALCLFPAHVWYLWRGDGWRTTLTSIAAFLLPLAGMLAYVLAGAPNAGGPFGNITAPLAWIPKYCSMNCQYPFFGWPHLIDTVNCLLALSPVAVLCWPEALWRSRQPLERYLALAALGSMALSVVWFPAFGYLPDWDIFTLAPMVLSFHVVYIAATQMPPQSFRRLALAWIVGSAVHAFSWWRYFHLNL